MKLLLWSGLCFALAAAPEGKDPSAICNDEYAVCREDCTMRFGTSVQTRDKLGPCLNRCTANTDTCLAKYLAPHPPSPVDAGTGTDAGLKSPSAPLR